MAVVGGHAAGAVGPAPPDVRTAPSKGIAEGVRHAAASRNPMPKHGEKAAKIVTEEGHRCLLVKRVKKRLESVSRILHPFTGQETKFHRADSVYRTTPQRHWSQGRP